MLLIFQTLYSPLRHPLHGLLAIKIVAIAALASSLAGLPDAALARAQVRSGVVTRVVDGDTVWVKVEVKAKANASPSLNGPSSSSSFSSARGVSGSETLKVRIVGIDAPEVCQTGGPESRNTLRSHLLGQVVTLTSPSSRSHDDYGRALARVDKQGEDVGRWMVRRGHAWSYGNRRSPGPYAAEQAQAQATRAGLFANSAAENPRSFRKRHGSCHP